MGLVGAAKAFGTDFLSNIKYDEMEIAQQIARSGMKSLEKNPSSFAENTYRNLSKNAGTEIDDEVVKALRKSKQKDGVISADGVEESVMSQINSHYASNKSGYEDIINAKELSKEQADWLGERHSMPGNAYQAGKAYFTQPGKRLARGSMVAGGLVGARYLSGGNVTHNNSGEKDIVGIPFV